PSKTTRTPKNVERVWTAVLKSPKRSACTHAVALQLSDRTVRRILHENLKFHPYKLVVVQKLNPADPEPPADPQIETILQELEQENDDPTLSIDHNHIAYLALSNEIPSLQIFFHIKYFLCCSKNQIV
ncbi:DUF4817 domain-containing protein, partial [Nephila pilipes]